MTLLLAEEVGPMEDDSLLRASSAVPNAWQKWRTCAFSRTALLIFMLYIFSLSLAVAVRPAIRYGFLHFAAATHTRFSDDSDPPYFAPNFFTVDLATSSSLISYSWAPALLV